MPIIHSKPCRKPTVAPKPVARAPAPTHKETMLALFKARGMVLVSGRVVATLKPGETVPDKRPVFDGGSWKDPAARVCLPTSDMFALLTGATSGVTVIDIDDCTTDCAKRLIPILDRTANFVQESPHGRHYLFAYDARFKTVAKPELALDVRNDGGLLFVDPTVYSYDTPPGVKSAKYNMVVMPAAGEPVATLPEEAVDFLRRAWPGYLHPAPPRAITFGTAPAPPAPLAGAGGPAPAPAPTETEPPVPAEAAPELVTAPWAQVAELVGMLKVQRVDGHEGWKSVIIAAKNASLPEDDTEVQAAVVALSSKSKKADLPATLKFWGTLQRGTYHGDFRALCNMAKEDAPKKYKAFQEARAEEERAAAPAPPRAIPGLPAAAFPEYEARRLAFEANHLILTNPGTIAIEEEEELAEMPFNRAMQSYSYLNFENEGRVIPFISTWMSDPAARRFKSVVNAPGGCSPEFYNSFRGWAGARLTCPVGEVGREGLDTFLDALKSVCGDNDEEYDYVCNWIAFLIQRPGEVPGVAVCCMGEQGTGKSRVFETIGDVLGASSVLKNLDNPVREILTNYNEVLRGVRLAILEEADRRMLHKYTSQIKAMVTAEVTSMRAMHTKAKQTPTYCAYVFLNNTSAGLPVEVEAGSRRYFATSASNRLRGKHEFWDKVAAARTGLWRQRETLKAIHDYFVGRDITEFNVRKFPASKLLKAALATNHTPVEEYLLWLARKGAAEAKAPKAWRLTNPEALDRYEEFCNETRVQQGARWTSIALGKALRDMTSRGWLTVHRGNPDYKVFDCEAILKDLAAPEEAMGPAEGEAAVEGAEATEEEAPTEAPPSKRPRLDTQDAFKDTYVPTFEEADEALETGAVVM